MFELMVFLAFGEPGAQTDHAARVVGIYSTLEQCDAARWDWWRRDALPEGYGKGWFQFMPGECEQRELVS